MQTIVRIVIMIVVMNIIHILLNIFQYGFIRTSCMPMDLSNFMGITSVLMIPSSGIVIFLLVCIVLQESMTQTMNSSVSESISDKEYL